MDGLSFDVMYVVTEVEVHGGIKEKKCGNHNVGTRLGLGHSTRGVRTVCLCWTRDAKEDVNNEEACDATGKPRE